MNAALPRSSKEQAREWARHFVESMARTARVRIQPEKTDAAFNNCVGKGGETAADGRYRLDYYAHARVAAADHSAAVRRVRDELERRGYRVLGFQDIKGAEASVILDAESRENDFSVSVEGSHRHDDLLFSVMTPCLLPPGAAQQRF